MTRLEENVQTNYGRARGRRVRARNWIDAAFAGLVVALLALALFALFAGRAEAAIDAAVAKVTDGDTIRVYSGQLPPGSHPVRLIGIDTPEVFGRRECGGREASAKLTRMLEPGDRVRLSFDSTQGRKDRYGRLLAYVTEGSRDAGERLVRMGWARPYVYRRPFRKAKLRAYYRANRIAQRHNRGVYQLCGRFES